MVEPGDNQRSNDEHQEPPPPARRSTFVRSLTVELTTSLIVSSLVASSPLLLVLSRDLGIALVVWGGVSLLLLAVLVVVLYRHPEFLRKVLELLPDDLARWSGTALVWVGTGAALAGLVLGAVAGVRTWLASGGACERPLEIRVVTTPEALTPLRAAAAGFIAGTRDGDCPEYAVTVTAEPGATPVRNGLARDWEQDRTGVGTQLLGPQPDVWVPSSPAEFDYASDRSDLAASGSPPALRPHPAPIGRSPMVLALFGDDDGTVYRESARPGREATTELLERFKEAKVRGIARPIPESSTAALAITPVLHQAVTNTGLAESGEAAERFVSPPDLLAPDAVSLLCQLRARAWEQPDGPPKGFAIAVPEHVLNDYNAGRALGDRCDAVDAGKAPYDKWKLYPYYARDLPALDYRFVQVKWPGQDDRERDGVVQRFREWLQDHPLTPQGLRTADGAFQRPAKPDPAHPYLDALDRPGAVTVPTVVKGTDAPGVQDSLDAIGAVRDKVLLTLLIDTSGSMGSPTTKRVNRSRLTHGVSVLRSLVGQLKGDDVIGVQSFARATGGDQTPPVTTHARSGLVSSQQADVVNGKLQALAAARSDLPLADAIQAADLQIGKKHVIVVTDGQSTRTNPDLAAALDRLEAFHDRHPDVVVTFLLTGPSACAGSPVAQVTKAVGGKCRELTGDPDEAQAARLLAELR
ncbi:vWA domain-containing protein [Actinomadura rudentiformis]|uniref:VWA domain-containing protein n=1 Tax=Actinomadura rudentiformis TaxID=359158 RepID=A0A6H9YRC8_9ACTN|nr:vWA domain-containing protein [Actinomadura rudentiformis]KAB2344303.1 VWA domain-containing protein [Actinomadura rudentiformis]